MSLLSSFWNEFLAKLSEIKGEKSVLYSVLKQTHLIELTEEKIIIGCDNQGIKKYLDPKLKEIEDHIYQNFKKRLFV